MARVLNIECSDRIGLVHLITGILLRENLNIIGNQEFVDRSAKRFFMRTEIDGAIDEARILAASSKALGPDAIVRFAPAEPRRLVVFASREHHCLGDLLIRNAYGELGATIVAVASNHESLRGLVDRFGLPFIAISAEGQSRLEHEKRLLDAVLPFRPDHLALAKYMRILSPEFIARFPQRIVNIHHSFLPAFVGANPYRRAFDRGVKIIGATAHLVTDALDEGPIIVQQVMPVDHSHSPEDLARAGRDIEQIVLAKALRLVFEDRVFVCENRTILFE